MSAIPQRLARIRAGLAEQELDLLLVEQPENRRYLSGFTGSAGRLVISPEEAFLVTDSRYYERVEREAPDVTLVPGPKPFEALGALLERLGARRVGFEADFVTVGLLAKLEEAAPDGLAWTPTQGMVEALRERKSIDEISVLRQAVALADRAMEHAWQVVRPGMTESELAWALERWMREHGAEAVAFDIIVAAGENGALPHHSPGDRRIQEGDPIVIDLGARLDGYHSDLTRTFSLGPARDEDYEAVWELVAEANRLAAEALRPGRTGVEVDAAAREHIAAGGYGEAFGHGLGHGVGLQIHEGPRLSPLAGDRPLQAGNVVTLEPGIYLPGRFGVRIEDIALVQPDGCEILTGVRKPTVVEAKGFTPAL